MAKVKKEFLTPMWLEIKLMYETGTNGSDKYGTNFLINGELDKKSRNFVDHIGAFTREFGWDCIIEDVKMDLWKERIWSLIENAGLLPEIAWKDDLAKDLKIAEEEAEDDVWELNIEEIEKGIYGNL
mgnify:CR=1 FL=1|jgi:hypothetical protein|tara:strand:- start:662 stop:1042 length:381 start_codon:yes stop_codon:yes gene_type:complete